MRGGMSIDRFNASTSTSTSTTEGHLICEAAFLFLSTLRLISALWVCQVL